MHTTFWLENLKGKDDSEDTEWFFGKEGGKMWTGFIWLRSGISSRLL
jgi:hypothetical protein